MSSSRRRTELALVLALAAAPCAAAPERIDAMPKLLSGEGVAVFALTAGGGVLDLEFVGPDDQLLKIARFRSDERLVFVRAAAGTWTLRSVTYRGGTPLRAKKDSDALAFEVAAGMLAYGGDFELRFESQAFVVSADGFNLDAFGDQARVMGVERRLLEALPLVLNGRAAAEAGRRGLPSTAASLAGFAAALPPRLGAAHGALVERTFARYGIAMPSPGTKRPALKEQLQKVGPADARVIVDDSRFGYLRFDGIWGDQGHVLLAQLLFAQDTLSAVRLRALSAQGELTMPPDDVLDDLEGWLDGR